MRVFDEFPKNINIRDWMSAVTGIRDGDIIRFRSIQRDINKANRLFSTRVVAADTTLTAEDGMVVSDTAAGDVTVSLPVNPSNGDVYRVSKSAAANTLTISGSGKNISGAASVNITTQYTVKAFQYVSGLSEWLEY